MDNEEIIKDQESGRLFVETRLKRLTNLLNHMKRDASTETQVVDLDAALDYAKEALSEFS